MTLIVAVFVDWVEEQRRWTIVIVKSLGNAANELAAIIRVLIEVIPATAAETATYNKSQHEHGYRQSSLLQYPYAQHCCKIVPILMAYYPFNISRKHTIWNIEKFSTPELALKYVFGLNMIRTWHISYNDGELCD